MNFEKLNAILEEFHGELKKGNHVFISPDGKSIYSIDFDKTNKATVLKNNHLYMQSRPEDKGYFMQKVKEMATIMHGLALEQMQKEAKEQPKLQVINPGMVNK